MLVGAKAGMIGARRLDSTKTCTPRPSPEESVKFKPGSRHTGLVIQTRGNVPNATLLDTLGKQSSTNSSPCLARIPHCEPVYSLLWAFAVLHMMTHDERIIEIIITKNMM